MARSRRRTGSRVPATTTAPVTKHERAAVRPAAAAFDDRLAVVLAFVGSGCLLILEIVAGRLLAPTVGVSLYTWTSVIGVVLAGVSVGNFLGGRLADRAPDRSTVALIYVAGSVASLAILGLVHFVDTLELPSGAPAILQVLWLNAVLFFVPSTILARCDAGADAAVAPRGRGGRTRRRPHPGGGVGREHRRDVPHRLPAHLGVRHAADRRGRRADAARAGDRRAAAVARRARLRARLARLRSSSSPARSRTARAYGRATTTASRSSTSRSRSRRLPAKTQAGRAATGRSTSTGCCTASATSATRASSTTTTSARTQCDREPPSDGQPRGRALPRRRLVHVPAFHGVEVRRQGRRRRDRSRGHAGRAAAARPRRLGTDRRAQHGRARAAALDAGRREGSTSSSATRSTTSRCRTT